MNCKEGSVLCGYRLLQECGAGSYGAVFLAEDAVGTRVAVKIIRHNGRCSEREIAGLRNYKDCSHPNLLRIRHIEILDDAVVCAMDAADDLNRGKGKYLPDTLANRLNIFKRMDGKDVSAMVDGLLAGLEELHGKGLVHRDIKPDNILWVNGRPTLADAGLIAQAGQGSLVGTPGFMSPKLLAGRGQAEPSDDFYALGKVIYCALTGNPVEDYPSLPKDVTISTDAALGRACRESCKKPVRSSAEFRLLMQEKDRPEPKFPAGKLLITIASVLILSAGGVLLWMKSGEKVPAPHAEAGETSSYAELPPDSPEDLELDKVLQEVAAELAEIQEGPRAKEDKALQSRALDFFRKTGALPGSGDMTAPLLDYKPMTMEEMVMLNSKTAKRISLHSEKLYSLLVKHPGDLTPAEAKERQDFWRKQSGAPAEIQRKMLESDRLMQALAVDFMIRQRIDSILREGRELSGQEETELEDLLRFRRELYISFRFMPK